VRNKFARAYDPENTANAKLDETAGIQTEEELNRIVDEFLAGLRKTFDAFAETHSSILKETEPIEAPMREVGKKGKQIGEKIPEDFSVVEELKDAYFAGRLSGLREKLQTLLIEHIHKAQMSEDLLNHQEACADMRFPLEWFPATRAMQRKIHLHVGPTNSGKTYHALQRLEAAQSGIYAGPLRLLAHEIYSRLNAKARPCALITGEERRDPEGGLKAIMSSCTVEMVPLNQKVDVAVVDEIQMIADPQRGWAWTAAFLGVQAKEVHLCGELRTVPLVEKLCQLMGDELTIHRYERLTPLRVMGKSFNGKLKKLEKGDCIILFSRVAIHAMKKEVERTTGKRCAVIYGSLPPETRAQQAALFNDPNNDYDFLVASDAVGMGLNLGIRRIIFESVVKYNGSGKTYKQLPVSEIKQIAGRAGRYRTAAQDIAGVAEEMDGPANSPQTWENVGLATTLDAADLPILRKAMEVEVEPITQAGLLPPAGIYKKFSAYFPRGTPFTYVLMRLNNIATVNPLFFACTLRDQMEIADAIEQYDLSVEDRLIMCASPANVRHDRAILEAFTERIANQTSANLLEIPELHLEILDEDNPGMDYLPQLEILHRAITLYLWLSYRFAGIFVSQPLAFHVKSLVEKRIDDALAAVHWDSDKRKMQKAMRDKALRQEMRRELDMVPEGAKEAPSPLSFAEEDDQEPLLEEIPGQGINIDVLEGGEVLQGLDDEEGLEVDEDEDDTLRGEPMSDAGNPDKEEVIESLQNEDDQPRTQPTSNAGDLKEEEVKMKEKEDNEPRAQPKSDAW